MIKKVVFDTNVYISFLLSSKGSILELYESWKSNKLLVCCSNDIYNEVKRALKYPKFKKYCKAEEIESLLDRIEVFCRFFSSKNYLKVCKDPDDDKFINLALDAGADCIITGDRDLLELEEFQGIKILSPKEFLSDVVELE